jgi:uncharacterized protein YbcV (DUF1398 family)
MPHCGNMLSITSNVRLVANAKARGMDQRPRVGGFPYLAEALRQASIHTVHCDVAPRTTTYRTPSGVVVDLHAPLTAGLAELAVFDRDAVIIAIRDDQRGESTYDEFMNAIWQAGVLTYDIDLTAHTCTYCGADPTTDAYCERYSAVSLRD